MQTAIDYKYLNLINLTNFDLWDTKRYTSKSIVSTFTIVDLGSCIKEENKKYKLFEKEDKEFGILGVNNKEGIFDAYTQKGKDINQAYKKMEIGWIAYNPYRINVGSIGVRLKEHKNEYISPAYVIFSCLDNLLPEYLFLLFKTERFNKVINESTTGSVRQNLTIDTLKKLQIPLPKISEQEAIVNAYQSKIQEAQNLERQAQDLEGEIESYFLEQLGMTKDLEIQVKKGLRLIEYKNFDRWDGNDANVLISKYPIEKIGKNILSISTGTTPPTSRKDYFNGKINFYTPVELGNSMYLNKSERTLTELAFKDKKARRFEKGTLLFVGIGSTVGKIGIVNNDFATSNQQITGFKLDNSVLLNEFVYYYFKICKNITIKEQTKATLPIVNQDKILNIPIPVPSITTQQNIVDSLNNLNIEIKASQTKSETLITQAEQEFERAIFS